MRRYILPFYFSGSDYSGFAVCLYMFRLYEDFRGDEGTRRKSPGLAP